MVKQPFAPWKAIKSRSRRREVTDFLQAVANAYYGTSQRKILAAAKKDFGLEIDWATILPVIMAYLPMLIELLKNR